MKTMRFTPKTVMSIAAVEFILLAGMALLFQMQISGSALIIGEMIFIVFGVSAAIIAFILYIDIAGEYRNFRSSRLIWQALAVNSVLLALKIIVSAPLFYMIFPIYKIDGLRGILNHLVSVPSHLCLLLALLGLLHSFNCAGMATKLKRLDYFLIAISILIITGLFVFHRYLEEGASPWTISRILQPIDLLILAMASIVSLVLQRYASGFNGGRLAESMRCLVAYGLFPIALVLLLQVFLPALHRILNIDLPPYLEWLWAFWPWMTTMAAAVRADITYRSLAQAAEIKQILQETQSALNLK